MAKKATFSQLTNALMNETLISDPSDDCFNQLTLQI